MPFSSPFRTGSSRQPRMSAFGFVGSALLLGAAAGMVSAPAVAQQAPQAMPDDAPVEKPPAHQQPHFEESPKGSNQEVQPTARPSSAQHEPQAPQAAPSQTPGLFVDNTQSSTPSEAPRPIAIVPLDKRFPGHAAEVTGSIQAFNGRAFITANASITSGPETTQVTLPYRGTLRICAATTVKIASDSSVPSGEIPGLMMAMDHGAVEASFATGRNSDFLLTPDFRILIGGPGAAEVKVRLGPKGDTCVDNAGVNAPYVLVTSVFDGGDYHVSAGQRVMFQHGSLHEVVDQEKEPCGCPPPQKGGNEFPLAQSEGLAPTLHPTPVPEGTLGTAAQSNETLTYNAAGQPEQTKPDTVPILELPPAAPAPQGAPERASPAAPSQQKPVQKKRGFFKKLGGFFKKVFGAD